MKLLPKRMYRVIYLAGKGGFPKYKYREENKRNFDSFDDAVAFVEMIHSIEPHHELIGVYAAETTWEPVKSEQLPEAVAS